MTHYTLTSDPWWCWTPGVPLSRPCYVNGRRVGSAGYASGPWSTPPPTYRTHAEALAHIINGVPPPMPDAHTLTVAEVLDLRVAAKATSYDPGAPTAAYAISYNASSHAYELRQGHASGPIVTAHADIAVIGALVRAERFEPGFMRRVLDASYMPDELALDVDARERSRRMRAENDAQSRARVREAQERAAAERRLTPPQDAPDDLSISDLFGTL